MRSIWLPSLMALQCLLAGPLQAAPQLDLRQQDRASLNIDVRAVWQTAIVLSGGLAPATPLDAQAVWQLPDRQFKPGQLAPMMVNDGERLVGRLSILTVASQQSLLIELPMPRLNVVHVAYRYSDEAWTQLSAGDQVPMVRWPIVSRTPVFVIPPKSGELQIVLEIPTADLFPSPVLLMGDPAFRAAQTIRNLQSGAALGLSFVAMLFCFGAAVILKRFAFVAVGLYAASIFLLTAGQGGIFGMYVGTTTAWFNDYVKYITGVVFGATVPWAISLVAAQKNYSKTVAYVANFWPVASLSAMLVMLFTVQRATQWAMLNTFLIASLLFGLGIALASVVRGQRHGVLSLAAMLLLCAGIVAPIASYSGYLDGRFSFSISAFSFLLSTTLLLLALLLQYRHGNRVIERAQRSSGRDALTGLLNRAVFEGRLAKIVREAPKSNSNALFMYIPVSDRDTLEQHFGGEGFESGMVQMAAALSSSISVVDTVARLSTNAFGVMVVMPPDVKAGNALAQKLITRIMAVASHSAPMAQTARIALAWAPASGSTLGNLELAAKKVLQKMEDGKRVGWVSGVMTTAKSVDTSGVASASQDSQSSSRPRPHELHSLINGIEDTMRREDFDAIQKRADQLTKDADTSAR